ncbi:hypothetical protein [Rhodanobacter denitrificans]|uniref:hypothetical protein n=1 Tax=Rhodanobacter denitrificans TaxID=666685 RepID=UPI0011C05358|nr:hypothetical protein [Rhodanobacter denitrificans]
MPPINFNTIPSGVKLSSGNIQRISERTTEAAAAYARKLEKLQATFAEARECFSRRKLSVAPFHCSSRS